MSNLDYKPFYRRNLPHIQPLGVTFFVTFRLAGSLPQTVLKQRAEEKRRLEEELACLTDSHERARRKLESQRQWFRRFEALIDEGRSGPLWLKDERIAKLVTESLHHRDGKVYSLDAYCIMPNHVHVVFTPNVKQVGNLPNVDYYSLSSILHSLKRYTARRANRLLGRSGAFWEHESYDHYIRNEREWERIVAYVLNNSVKGGLVQDWHEWQWSYYRYA